MGSSTILDIIGSFFVAGVLLLMGLNLDTSAVATSAAYNSNLVQQQNMTTLVQMLEYDFRKIAYCKDWTKIPNPPSLSIRIAEQNRIRFWTDIGNDGTMDSLTYYLGSPSELSQTANPRDCYLYRQVNSGVPDKWNLGVTQFNFRYFDANEIVMPTPVTDLGSVWMIELTIAIENQNPYQRMGGEDTSKYIVYWRQMRLATKNLRNR